MTNIETDLPGLLILEPKVFTDHRGTFFEPFNQKRFQEATGLDITFVQDNESESSRNVIRGLHFQEPPAGQAKLIRVVCGSVIDVAVDLRVGSPTYRKHLAVSLSASNRRQLFIPEGFAHGFLSLENHTIVCYKCSGFYNPEFERSLKWDDPELAIPWGVEDPELSDKDKSAPMFSAYNSPFRF